MVKWDGRRKGEEGMMSTEKKKGREWRRIGRRKKKDKREMEKNRDEGK